MIDSVAPKPSDRRPGVRRGERSDLDGSISSGISLTPWRGKRTDVFFPEAVACRIFLTQLSHRGATL